MNEWQPTASRQTLKTKARMLSQLRAFFAEKDILEVQTPLLSQAGNTEPSIESFATVQQHNNQSSFLNTSPEFAMKRLIAAGSGSIYQVTAAFRVSEQGRKHNPEFTLLEWYRIGFDHYVLMAEVDALIRMLAQDFLSLDKSQFYTYQDAMIKFADIDPFAASNEELKLATQKAGIDAIGMDDATKDSWLDLLMSQVVEKNLPLNCPVFIYNYPASQAALAKITKGLPDVAERFELYINGMELANGFHELADAKEQEKRFLKQQALRKELKQDEIPIDYHLLSALEQGLPDCAGVAVGLDRLLMLMTGASSIDEVLTFPFDRA